MAIDYILHKGKETQIYNVSAHEEIDNLTLIHKILAILGKSDDLITFVNDRPGHDRRYAIDSSKLRSELGWEPKHTDFAEGLKATIAWYRDNPAWWQGAKEAVEAKYAKQGQ